MDEKIRGSISILNSRGIPTTGSCEGHIDHGSPAPWVKVTPPPAKAVPILRRASRYLNAFYENRTVTRDVRIAIAKAHSGFWIHNGGAGYNRWRAFVNESATKIRRGEKIKAYFDSIERARRSKKLSVYQKEMEAFAEFIKGEVRRK